MNSSFGPLMTLSRTLNKPEYIFQPRQLLRRLKSTVIRDTGRRELTLPWGSRLSVEPDEAIGHSLSTLGVYELGVSETLWRLTAAGDACLDVGANIGYMTTVLAVRAGKTGCVYAFEPHPFVYRRLVANLAKMAAGAASCEPHCIAVSDADELVQLLESDAFERNQGTATIMRSADRNIAASRRVEGIRLDTIFPDLRRFGVLKVDVEGGEFLVLRGARRLLENRQVRDIVWEDHEAFPSPAAVFLEAAGYVTFRISKRLRGPKLSDPRGEGETQGLPWEPSNYLATHEPERALGLMKPRGWQCLRR